MGILSKIMDAVKGSQTMNAQGTVAVVNNEVGAVPAPPTGLLDLSKGDILDLTKYSDNLKNVRAAAGWDVNTSGGSNYDLDLCAYLMSKGKLIGTVGYFNKSETGLYLDGDNLTGSGEGDDENIHVTLDSIPAKVDKIVFAVVIYQGANRRQTFSKITNAYMRLVDESNGAEICRYRLTEDGGHNTAAVMASLNRVGGKWEFEAIGNYSRDTIQSLGSKIR